MGGGCDSLGVESQSGCCDISTNINVGLQDVAVADSHHSKQVLSLDAAQPPPVILTTNEILLPLPSASLAVDINDIYLALSSPGTHTYLITNRFRI